MPETRCCYFSTTIVTLTEVEHATLVRVPRYNCRLMDTLLQRLHSDTESQQIASSLETDDLGGQRFCIYGPDLEIRSPTGCTQKRCRESCTPEFTRWMQAYGLDSSLPAME